MPEKIVQLNEEGIKADQGIGPWQLKNIYAKVKFYIDRGRGEIYNKNRL